MPLPAALLWDVDGTLAETELDGHRLAFNRALAEAGLPWRWDAANYLSLLTISGGRERLRSFLEQVEGAPPSTSRVEALQAAKQRHYGALVAGGGLSLRPGVARLLDAAAAAGIPQVIVTTSGRPAVSALLEQVLPRSEQLFRFWVCGDDVATKKPHPEAYRLALAQLGCDAAQAVAIEDSGNGLRSARGAGLSTLVTRSASSAAEPAVAFSAAAAVVDHLGEPDCPCVLLRGPACPDGCITLSYLQLLLERP